MNKLMSKIFLISFLIAICASQKADKPKCKNNEEYVKAYYTDGKCFKAGTKLAKPAWMCSCKNNYVRDIDGKCIHESYCVVCNINEEYTLSDTSDATCISEATKEKRRTKACRCKTGHVRWLGACIPTSNCPKCIRKLESLVFTEHSDGTCLQPGAPLGSATWLCRCPEGMVRDADNECLPLKDCEECGVNAEYGYIAKYDDTCYEEGAVMEQPGHLCHCITGYVRDKHGACIEKCDCDKSDSHNDEEEDEKEHTEEVKEEPEEKTEKPKIKQEEVKQPAKKEVQEYVKKEYDSEKSYGY